MTPEQRSYKWMVTITYNSRWHVNAKRYHFPTRQKCRNFRQRSLDRWAVVFNSNPANKPKFKIEKVF